jgi:hypothetical protein
MNARTQVLKQLVSESRYVVDPHAVADAIVARAMAGGRSGQLFAVPPSSRRSARVDGDTRRRRSG